jgi:hypothetical protein
MQKTLVLSLSEINDSILMRSHYAENHKGVCLGFKTHIANEILGLMFEEGNLRAPVENVPAGFIRAESVNYSVDMPPAYNPLRDDVSDAFRFIFSKHVNWSYEKERRSILSTRIALSQNIKFRKKILRQLIFGMRTSDDNREKIKELVQREYYHKGYSVEYFQAVPIEGKCQIEIERL